MIATSTRQTPAHEGRVRRSGAPRPARSGNERRVRAERHPGRASRATGCATPRSGRPTSARPAAPRPVVPAGTRLTARGRALVVALLVLLLLAAFSLGRTGAEGSTAVQPRVQVEEATVMPGETLWVVAQRIAPGRDPRPVVDQIRRLNGLSSGELQAGQQLLLPVAP